MHRKYLIILFAACCLCFKIYGNDNQSTGLFSYAKLDDALQIIAHFIPPSPNILLIGYTSEICQKCIAKWPQAVIFTSLDEYKRVGSHIDYLWINDTNQCYLSVLKSNKDILKDVQAIYKTGINLSRTPSDTIEVTYLQKREFQICTHWKEQERREGIFFLKKAIYDAFFRTLNYTPPESPYSFPIFNEFPIEKFVRKLEGKSSIHSMSQIEYIYIINLDERPEKLSQSLTALKPYGIIPHRFPAVNGKKLPIDVISQVGLKYEQGMIGSKYMGTVFRKIGEREYKNIEFINTIGTTYFHPGITRGAIGCLLSHISVLYDAYVSNYHTIWVMEDDIQIINNPSELPFLIQELDRIDPEWDILFTDVNSKNSKGQYVPCCALAMRPNINIEPLSCFLQKAYRVNDRFSRLSMRYGAYSMIIRRSGIKKILEFFRKNSLFLPYDVDFWLTPTMRMYCVNKDIISTIPNALTDNR